MSDVDKIRARPRVFDFFTLEGIERLTGCTPDKFLQFMTKELLDNSLDKQDTKNIRVDIHREGKLLTLSVSDDGKPTFDSQTISKILDFDKAPSSKRGLKCVRRGVLGNGFQSCLGVSYAKWPADERPENTAEIWGTKKFLIKLNPVKNSVREEPCENSNLTVVLFKLPTGDYLSPFGIVRTIAMLNQHVNLTYNDEEMQETFAASETVSPPAQTEVDVHFYSSAEFSDFADEMKQLTLERFITIFKGLKNRSYAKKVLDELGTKSGTRLSELSAKEFQVLYNTMKKAAKTVKASQLPLVGEESFDNYGALNYSVKRGTWNDEDGKLVPYAVQAASFEDEDEEIYETINFSASIHHPFTRYIFNEGEKRVKLNDFIKDKGLSVLVHLVCPAITWLSASKGELNIYPFQEAIFSAIRHVCRQNKVSGFDYETLISLTNKVMNSYPTFSFTLRQVFYLLVSHHGYPNEKQAYNKLGKALVKARQEGSVDADRILDLSRPEYINNSPFQSFQERITSDFKTLINNFDLDRWSLQPIYVETWIEKEALSRIIAQVCEKYSVNEIVGRGYSSYTQIRRAVKRLPEDKKVIIVYTGDFDASGLDIEEKLRERLIDEAWRRGKHLQLEVRRVALTYKQIQQYRLPASPLKKFGQKRQEYLEKYGSGVWEVDALSPEVLMKTLEEEIRGLIDWEIWDKKAEEIQYFKGLIKEGLRRFLDELSAFE